MEGSLPQLKLRTEPLQGFREIAKGLSPTDPADVPGLSDQCLEVHTSGSLRENSATVEPGKVEGQMQGAIALPEEVQPHSGLKLPFSRESETDSLPMPVPRAMAAGLFGDQSRPFVVASQVPSGLPQPGSVPESVQGSLATHPVKLGSLKPPVHLKSHAVESEKVQGRWPGATATSGGLLSHLGAKVPPFQNPVVLTGTVPVPVQLARVTGLPGAKPFSCPPRLSHL